MRQCDRGGGAAAAGVGGGGGAGGGRGCAGLGGCGLLRALVGGGRCNCGSTCCGRCGELALTGCVSGARGGGLAHMRSPRLGPGGAAQPHPRRAAVSSLTSRRTRLPCDKRSALLRSKGAERAGTTGRRANGSTGGFLRSRRGRASRPRTVWGPGRAFAGGGGGPGGRSARDASATGVRRECSRSRADGRTWHWPARGGSRRCLAPFRLVHPWRRCGSGARPDSAARGRGGRRLRNARR
mmetsp:Transcript_11623/g.38332  ORF Transcript_11623/g.38332 Transcript_11623/m.38332 type:complete len:239 (-) Transcript_11623:138-854(-)